jgi:hypothetical protein
MLLFGSNRLAFSFIPYPVTSPQPGDTMTLGFNYSFALINIEKDDNRSIVITTILGIMMIFIFTIIRIFNY